MIQSDQPACFPSNLLVSVSSRADGTMLDKSAGTHSSEVVKNRTNFCQANDINYQNVVYQRIVYSDDRSYELICEVDSGSTTKHTSEVVADALITRSKGVALMLPVADCVATVLYDPGTEALALLHLGRHSTLTSLLSRTVQKMINDGAKVENMIVWMSPSIQATDYIMEYFDHHDDPAWQNFYTKEDDGYHLDMQGFNRQTCLNEGLSTHNIHISPINTASNSDYFSHSSGETSGRFAVVAMMLQ